MDVGLSLTGLTGRALLLAAGNTDNAARKAGGQAAEHIVAGALPQVPRRSGTLRSSVSARTSGSQGQAVATARHAAAIHWGRRVGNVGSPPGNRLGRNPIRGRPFLAAAAAREVPQIENIYRDEMVGVIDDVL